VKASGEFFLRQVERARINLTCGVRFMRLKSVQHPLVAPFVGMAATTRCAR
jgi:hypothetical protein